MTGWRRLPFRLTAFAAAIRDSYWFIPAMLAFTGLIAGILLVSIDVRLAENWFAGSDLLRGNRPEGARAMLSTIAGSTITVAGVVFSVTLAAVTYAAGQHGPRLLTNFARDTGNQLTLGVFIGTYVYCLVVLRTVRSAGETGRANDYFVPHFAVYAALGLALVSIAMLIYFVHHVTQTIHINNVIARIGEALVRDIRANAGAEASSAAATAVFEAKTAKIAITAKKAGYLQGIDYAGLETLAAKQAVSGRLACRPGNFVDVGDCLIELHMAVGEDVGSRGRWRDAFTVGSRKTDLQDLRFGFDELNEIATRALSPGINDPFTAIACIDWLGAAVSEFDRALASLPGETAPSRIVIPARTFEDYLEVAFGRLRPHALATDAVTQVAVHTLARLAKASKIAEHRSALLLEQSRYLDPREA